MVENCTIYCKTKDLGEVERLIRERFPSPNSMGGKWESLHMHGNAGTTLRLTAKWYRERGDDFCRLLLSTCVFLEGLSGADAQTKSRLASHVESCELVVGVVADPAFDSDERYTMAVYSIANAMDGVIFNGQDMIDADGQILITCT